MNDEIDAPPTKRCRKENEKLKESDENNQSEKVDNQKVDNVAECYSDNDTMMKVNGHYGDKEMMSRKSSIISENGYNNSSVYDSILSFPLEPTKTTIMKDDDETTTTTTTTTTIQNDRLLLQSYLNAKPYPHGIVSNMFKKEFLLDVLHELKHYAKVKFKESDLFRVYQSIDLANLVDTTTSNTTTTTTTKSCPSKSVEEQT